MQRERKSRRAEIDSTERYVSRSAYKLESIYTALKLDLKDKTVLDVGSSTGGFSDFALKHGAKKIIAVEKGTNQMNPVLLTDTRIELHEKTDILDFKTDKKIDLILIDVSFVSLRDVLPSIYKLADKQTVIVAMAKPQFETRDDKLKNNGIIKNERIRREILTSLETWMRRKFVVIAKADSHIFGTKGNRERFFKLTCSK